MRVRSIAFAAALLAMFSPSRPATAGNPYLNPPGVQDGLEIRETARDLLAGGNAQSVEATPDGTGIRLVAGATRGTLALRPFVAKFPFNEAIPSWNGRVTAPDTGFRVLMRVPEQEGSAEGTSLIGYRKSAQSGKWFPVGYWGAIADDPATTRVLKVAQDGKFDEDHLLLGTQVQAAEIAIELRRAEPAAESPVMRLVALSYTNANPSSSIAGYPVPGPAPGPRSITLGTTLSIPLPYRMQLAATKKLTNSICSPASVSAALGRFGVQTTPTDIANIAYDRPSDIYGMWNRSVQAGAQMGLRGYITRFRDWNAVRKVIRQGGVICPSIRFRGGEVDDPLRRHGRRMDGTKGHIVAIKGLAPRGTVIIQDPASKDWGPDSVWTQDDFAKAWFDKGGVGYVFTGPAGR